MTIICESHDLDVPSKPLPVATIRVHAATEVADYQGIPTTRAAPPPSKVAKIRSTEAKRLLRILSIQNGYGLTVCAGFQPRNARVSEFERKLAHSRA